MPDRNTRNTVILLKQEATYGVDAVPVAATDALVVSNINITPFSAQNVDRDIIRPWLGGSEQAAGPRYVQMSFDVEFSGPSVIATAPAWAPTLMACGNAQVLTATIRSDYIPISSNFTSATIYWHSDGMRHIAVGCRANAVVRMGVGGLPKISYTFWGLYRTPTVVANPNGVYTAFTVPQAIMDANTGDLILGGTHATGTAPAIVGGLSFPSQGIEIDYGNKIDFNALLGGETISLTQRNVTAKVVLDLDPTQEVALYTAVENNTLTSVGLQHGTIANQKVLIWMPAVQRINPGKVDVNGKLMVSVDMRAVPVAGNDEIRLVTGFA